MVLLHFTRIQGVGMKQKIQMFVAAMKHKKHILMISLLIVVVLGLVITQLPKKTCVADGNTVCYIKKTDNYLIETGAKVIVEVSTQAYGDALVNLWKNSHPDTPETLTYVLNSAVKPSDLLASGTVDLAYLTQNEAALVYNSIKGVDENLQISLTDNILTDKSAVLNREVLKFIPMSGSGFSFIYEENMLTKLGVDLTDANLDGLPDAIDSWEKIEALMLVWSTLDPTLQPEAIFPFALNEIYSFYPFMTAGGWNLFPNNDVTKPGFDSAQFLLALQQIQRTGTIAWKRSEAQLTAVSYGWQYDQILSSKNFVFSMAAPWMFVAANEKKNSTNIHFAKFPTFNGIQPTPLLEVNGYVINSITKFPSAANEVLKLIRSTAGLQAFIDTTSEFPLVNETLLSQLVFADQNRQELAHSYISSFSEPLIALPNNPSVLGFDMLTKIDLVNIIAQVWDQKLAPTDAQTQIVANAQAWIEKNNTVAK